MKLYLLTLELIDEEDESVGTEELEAEEEDIAPRSLHALHGIDTENEN